MIAANFDQIRSAIDKKNYKFFSSGLYNLNLIGVRSSNSESDQFDDHFHVIYRGDDNRFKHHTFACTTDPGKHWLLNPMNINGCAIMVPGQYIGAYALGKHKGEYDAFVQVGAIDFVRDNNKNTKLDFSLYAQENRKANVKREVIGANIHRASVLKKALNVGFASAGCQVLQNDQDLQTSLFLAHKNIEHDNGERFSYTLLEEADIK